MKESYPVMEEFINDFCGLERSPETGRETRVKNEGTTYEGLLAVYEIEHDEVQTYLLVQILDCLKELKRINHNVA